MAEKYIIEAAMAAYAAAMDAETEGMEDQDALRRRLAAAIDAALSVEPPGTAAKAELMDVIAVLASGRPELIEAVERGEITVFAAAKIAAMPKKRTPESRLAAT